MIIPYSLADTIAIENNGTGDFFPAEDCSLIMTNASVIFDISFQEPYDQIDVSFRGNYTIYNPNADQNITLAAPFSPDFKNLESTCNIEVDDEPKPFTIHDYHWSDPWAEYLESKNLGITISRNFILTNVTFPENSSITLEYSFDAYIVPDINDDQLDIFYDVGTSRAWNGSISESVEFKIYGKLPDAYSKNIPEFFNYTCTISNFSNGRSYIWEWVDETIMINQVYISYSYSHRFIRLITTIIIVACYLGVPLIIVLIVLTLRKRYKRKRNESLHQKQSKNK
jgi:hypothetical protein